MWLRRNAFRDSRQENMPGCYNTGHSPAVGHFDNALLGEFYVVGPAKGIIYEGARWDMYMYLDKHPTARVFRHPDGYALRFYRTMPPARKAYEKAVKEAKAAFEAQAAKIKDLQTRAKAGDIGAALDLSDYL